MIALTPLSLQFNRDWTISYGALGAWVNPLESDSRPCRVVVQHVKEGERWSYRLVTYEDRKVHPPVGFTSLEAVIRTLGSVLPDFPVDKLQVREQAGATYIAYAGEWPMDDAQLAQLASADESHR